MDAPLFFSIVIPAHNEEKYIDKTLQLLGQLDYPKENYEIIVVENGSSDNTFAVAKKYEKPHIKVLTFTEKGVAFARNRGIDASNPKADWVLFLDADTHIQATCLRELVAFLSSNASKRYSMGTSSIKPDPDSIVGRFYFLWQDGLHYLSKTAYGAFFVVRRGILDEHRFDEKLSITEDGEICNAARSTGTFFFLNTSSVSTSTRRFDSLGWLGTLLSSVRIALLPLEKRREIIYKVIR